MTTWRGPAPAPLACGLGAAGLPSPRCPPLSRPKAQRPFALHARAARPYTASPPVRCCAGPEHGRCCGSAALRQPEKTRTGLQAGCCGSASPSPQNSTASPALKTPKYRPPSGTGGRPSDLCAALSIGSMSPEKHASCPSCLSLHCKPPSLAPRTWRESHARRGFALPCRQKWHGECCGSATVGQPEKSWAGLHLRCCGSASPSPQNSKALGMATPALKTPSI